MVLNENTANFMCGGDGVIASTVEAQARRDKKEIERLLAEIVRLRMLLVGRDENGKLLPANGGGQ